MRIQVIEYWGLCIYNYLYFIRSKSNNMNEIMNNNEKIKELEIINNFYINSLHNITDSDFFDYIIVYYYY